MRFLWPLYRQQLDKKMFNANNISCNAFSIKLLAIIRTMSCKINFRYLHPLFRRVEDPIIQGNDFEIDFFMLFA